MKNDKEKFKNEFKIRVYRFVLELIKFIDSLPNDKSSKIISDQLLRSGTSIGANYFEAIAASSRKDFTNFFHHALKSANETKFWLAILRDTNKGNISTTNNLLKETKELANILASSLITLKSKK